MATAHKPSLFGKTRQKVLSLLFSNADRSYYLREIVRQTSCGLGAVQHELKLLTSLGYLEREKNGKQVYFKANKRNPVFQELKGFIIKTYGYAALLTQALQILERRIEVAFIFGSFATGDEHSDSDIDIIVIGDVSLQDVVTATMDVREYLNRDITPIVYPIPEFKERLSKKDHFLLHVLENPKIYLIGNVDELEGLGREGIS
ncbi:MAG TPA: nucleotidyltransferase domain-containing protein [Acidobacteriota bacterium]|nr:nucleotidyltransferase domain-containing protein [Acidobacteriota bacterium]